MWSSAPSEAVSGPSRPAGAGRDPADARSAAAAAAARRAPAGAQADLPAADQPPRGARLGGSSSGPGSTRSSPARCPASRSCPARSFRSKGETIAWCGPPTKRASPRIAAGRVALRRSARRAFARRIETFLKRRALDTLSRETAEIAAVAGVIAKLGQRRRCRHALGQLLGAAAHPLQLAADPRAAGRAALRRRARSRAPRPPRSRRRRSSSSRRSCSRISTAATSPPREPYCGGSGRG